MGLPLTSPVCRRLLEVDRATPERRGSSGARHVIRWACPFGRPKAAIGRPGDLAPALRGPGPVRNNRRRAKTHACDGCGVVASGRPSTTCPHLFSRVQFAPRAVAATSRRWLLPVRSTLPRLPGGVTFMPSLRRRRTTPSRLVSLCLGNASKPPAQAGHRTAIAAIDLP